MKALKKVLIVFPVVSVLLFAGCPSPFSQGFSGDEYQTSATIDTSRMVFVEEDGSEIPLVTQTGDGPVSVTDFVVLNDNNGSSRSVDGGRSPRCIVVGRRSNGRSAVWIIYRYGGMVVVPNEDGDEDSELLELTSSDDTPWAGSDWTYEAKAVSPDGKVIIGQLSKPEWTYLDGEVPEPEIGVWWSVFHGDDSTYVSRARPMLMMREPVESTARCLDDGWRQRWVDFIIEWLQAYILSESWNYMSDVDGFVASSDVEGGIPEDYYVVSGKDRSGDSSRAWLTALSMENIEAAPDDTPTVPGTDPNEPPWPITGPGTGDDTAAYIPFSNSTGIQLEITGDTGVITDPAFFDPDGDDVQFVVVPVAGSMSDGSTPPAASVSGSGLFNVDNWSDSYLYMRGIYTITITNDIDSAEWTRTPPEAFTLKVQFLP